MPRLRKYFRTIFPQFYHHSPQPEVNSVVQVVGDEQPRIKAVEEEVVVSGREKLDKQRHTLLLIGDQEKVGVAAGEAENVG